MNGDGSTLSPRVMDYYDFLCLQKHVDLSTCSLNIATSQRLASLLHSKNSVIEELNLSNSLNNPDGEISLSLILRAVATKSTLKTLHVKG